jgi:hypothetical protein
MPIVQIECSMRKWANIRFRLNIKLRNLFRKPNREAGNVPIIINNFNRLSYLKRQIDWLENAGYKNIYIIDNQSTYPPLLEYYKKLSYTIFRLDRNFGYRALFDTHIMLNFINDYYVYTDSDILPIRDCPVDVLRQMKDLLSKYPNIGKIGFGLIIDDLPDNYILKQKVVDYESKYWLSKINDEVYDALVDTTFALYRPGVKGDWQVKAYRTSYPYLAHHLPWYENSSQPSDEELYYIAKSNANSLWYSNLKNNSI